MRNRRQQRERARPPRFAKDLYQSIYPALGIDPETATTSPIGRPIKLAEEGATVR